MFFFDIVVSTNITWIGIACTDTKGKLTNAWAFKNTVTNAKRGEAIVALKAFDAPRV